MAFRKNIYENNTPFKSILNKKLQSKLQMVQSEVI